METDGFSQFEFSIEGLEGLKTLTSFNMVCSHEYHCSFPTSGNVGKLPATLKVLEVDAAIVFERDVLALCTNLVSLKPRRVCTSDLDLKSWTSLQEVELTSNHPHDIQYFERVGSSQSNIVHLDIQKFPMRDSSK